MEKIKWHCATGLNQQCTWPSWRKAAQPTSAFQPRAVKQGTIPPLLAARFTGRFWSADGEWPGKVLPGR
jgi:hypothetical protein